MAFWRVAGLATTSPVEQILDKEDYTLEDLLDEDDVIQECRSLNARLISFLREKAQIERLLKYLVEPQEPAGEPGSAVTRYPFVACEILCCEIDAIFSTLLEDEELMAILFSFLDKKENINCLKAGYFSRVVSCLLLRRTPDLTRYLQDRTEILTKLVDEAEFTSIAEILMRLVGADEQILMFHSFALQWLSDTTLLQQLVDKLSPEHSEGMHANVAEILSAVARTSPSGLASQLSTPPYIDGLFTHAFEGGDGSTSVLVAALSICITLLDPKRSMMQRMGGLLDPSDLTQMGLGGGEEAVDPDAVNAVLGQLGKLVGMLDSDGNRPEIPATYGYLRPPLGTRRLKAVQLISMVLQVGGEVAVQAVIEHDVIRKCLDLFLTYPFNNFLHHEVEAMVLFALEGRSADLTEHLIAHCGLVGLLADAPVTLEPGAGKACIPGQAIRAGYVGHVNHMGRRLMEAEENVPAVAELLEADSGWGGWKNGALAERLDAEDLGKWACGRPSTTEQPDASSDGDDDFRNEFDMAGMTGNLNQDVYHRYGMYDAEDGDGDGEEFEGEEIVTDEGDAVAVDAAAIGLAGALLPGRDGGGGGDSSSSDEDSDEDTTGVLVAPLPGGGARGAGGDGDDDVLVGGSDDEDSDEDEGGGAAVVPMGAGGGGGGVMPARPATPATPPAPGMMPPDLSGLPPRPATPATPPMFGLHQPTAGQQQQQMMHHHARGGGGGAAAQHKAPGGAGEKGEEGGAEFNAFSYWKPSYSFDVPDDI